MAPKRSLPYPRRMCEWMCGYERSIFFFLSHTDTCWDATLIG